MKEFLAKNRERAFLWREALRRTDIKAPYEAMVKYGLWEAIPKGAVVYKKK